MKAAGRSEFWARLSWEGGMRNVHRTKERFGRSGRHVKGGWVLQHDSVERQTWMGIPAYWFIALWPWALLTWPSSLCNEHYKISFFGNCEEQARHCILEGPGEWSACSRHLISATSLSLYYKPIAQAPILIKSCSFITGRGCYLLQSYPMVSGSKKQKKELKRAQKERGKKAQKRGKNSKKWNRGETVTVL